MLFGAVRRRRLDAQRGRARTVEDDGNLAVAADDSIGLEGLRRKASGRLAQIGFLRGHGPHPRTRGERHSHGNSARGPECPALRPYPHLWTWQVTQRAPTSATVPVRARSGTGNASQVRCRAPCSARDWPAPARVTWDLRHTIRSLSRTGPRQRRCRVHRWAKNGQASAAATPRGTRRRRASAGRVDLIGVCAMATLGVAHLDTAADRQHHVVLGAGWRAWAGSGVSSPAPR